MLKNQRDQLLAEMTSCCLLEFSAPWDAVVGCQVNEECLPLLLLRENAERVGRRVTLPFLKQLSVFEQTGGIRDHNLQSVPSLPSASRTRPRRRQASPNAAMTDEGRVNEPSNPVSMSHRPVEI